MIKVVKRLLHDAMTWTIKKHCLPDPSSQHLDVQLTFKHKYIYRNAHEIDLIKLALCTFIWRYVDKLQGVLAFACSFSPTIKLYKIYPNNMHCLSDQHVEHPDTRVTPLTLETHAYWEGAYGQQITWYYIHMLFKGACRENQKSMNIKYDQFIFWIWGST